VAGDVSAVPKVLRFPAVGSTMDLLHELAAEGAAEGTVVVASEQTSGRGSRGRTWHSPPGGLWLSALYRPRGPAGAELLSLRVGLAVAEAIEAVASGVRLAIKWPNDLMLDDRKLGGILCEARWHGEALGWIVVGIGLNVSNPIPVELATGAIRLADRMPDISPEALEAPVTARLRALDPARNRLDAAEVCFLRERDYLRGRRLLAPVAGLADGIAEDGALLVRGGDGAARGIRAGTVELAEPSFTP
jgi:BirA family transcriptional regulator, biotin operon repressor / biotin---[acetyl-CoA-carboxylase] ligase